MHVNRQIVILEEHIQYMTGRLASESMPASKTVILKNLNLTKQKIKYLKRKPR